MRKHANDRRPDLFGLTETHLIKGDAIKQLFPPGYKAVARLDRSKHGGGLVIGAKQPAGRLSESRDVKSTASG